MSTYLFEKPLIRGTLLKRKSQFTALVDINGEEFIAHIPTTTNPALTFRAAFGMMLILRELQAQLQMEAASYGFRLFQRPTDHRAAEHGITRNGVLNEK
jgi:hypothetical protein